jgi:hypothetical protein
MIRVEVGDTEVRRWRAEGQRFGISEHWKRDYDKRRLRVSLLH